MTAPNNPNERAKTAEEVFNDYWIHGGPTRETCKKHFIKALESYADSVAEERVKKEIICCWDPKSECNNALRQIATIHTKGFRAGQERMRERIKKWIAGPDQCESERCSHNGFETCLGSYIYSLDVEEK